MARPEQNWITFEIDGKQVRAINKRFGDRPLKDYPVLTYRRYYLEFMAARRIHVVKPLNWVDYDPAAARGLLETQLGWRDYGGKHAESRWTKFFQNYYLPTYFGFDKRRAHLSSLILAGQMSRDDALRILEQPPFDPHEVELEKDYIARKLGVPVDEFQRLLEIPKQSWQDYPNDDALNRFVQSPRSTRLKRLLPRK